MRQLESYVAPNGRKPFDEWIEKMPLEMQARINAYIRRVLHGAARRNVKKLKGSGGILEMRIDTGPGYRVYFTDTGPGHPKGKRVLEGIP